MPPNVLKAESYIETLGDAAVHQFVETVGVRERRHVSDGMTASDLCVAAAEHLLERLAVEKETIQGLIFVSQTTDYVIPTTACVLQERLGLSEDCFAYDVGLGCSGYVYGLHIAASAMQSGYIKRVLLLTGELDQSSPQDKSQMMLLGEAGTATLLEYDETAPDMRFLLKTIGSGFNHLIIPSGGARRPDGSHEIRDRGDGLFRSDFHTYMNGMEVFKFTIKEVPKLITHFFDQFQLQSGDFDYFVFHQANKFILDNILRKLKCPSEKMPLSLDRYGNTGCSSAAVTLCDHFDSQAMSNMSNRAEKRILLAGFGSGLSLAAADVVVDAEACFPIIESELIWDDGMH